MPEPNIHERPEPEQVHLTPTAERDAVFFGRLVILRLLECDGADAVIRADARMAARYGIRALQAAGRWAA